MAEPLIFDEDHIRYILRAYISDFKFRHKNELPSQIVFHKIEEYEGIKVVYEDAQAVSRDTEAEPPIEEPECELCSRDGTPDNPIELTSDGMAVCKECKEKRHADGGLERTSEHSGAAEPEHPSVSRKPQPKKPK